MIYLPSKQSPSTHPRIPHMLPLFMRPFFIFHTFAPDSRRRPSALARLTVRFSASPSRRSRPSWQSRPMAVRKWKPEPEEFPNQLVLFHILNRCLLHDLPMFPVAKRCKVPYPVIPLRFLFGNFSPRFFSAALDADLPRRYDGGYDCTPDWQMSKSTSGTFLEEPWLKLEILI